MQQQKEQKLTRVKDQLSQWHELKKELGKGGQGVVYRTADSELLVKMPLKNGKEITDKEEINHFQKRFENLYLLPLTNKMHITRPLYLLEGQAGYVMQMMQDMQPIGKWLPQILNKQLAKTFTRPSWLSEEVPLEVAYSLAMYANTGGTKRRLELLSQTSIVLLRLHSVGVIFMDISPDNIYCSTKPEHSEVWMIDADNLRFEGVSSKSGVITPQYGAPEIVKGIDGGRVVSDTYSLALLAFKILTMSNAFEGQLFSDVVGDEDDWATDDSESSKPNLEVQAAQGELPFIFDAEDNSNSRVNGLPAELVLTPDVLYFFQRMFGKGRKEPWQRPSLHSLPRLLAKAADSSIQCHCGMSFYYQSTNDTQSCPYCNEHHSKLLVATSYFYTSEGVSDPIWTWVTPFIDGQNIQLPRRISGDFDIDQHNMPMIEVNQFDQDRFLYVSAEDVRVDILDNNHVQQLTNQWFLNEQQIEEGVQLYLHAPYSVIIEIKVKENNAIQTTQY
jgi:serine/threonine protein kinase